MIRAEQIPDEVAEAFRKAWMDGNLTARAAIAAAINAWPDSILMPAELILPLPSEEGDA